MYFCGHAQMIAFSCVQSLSYIADDNCVILFQHFDVEPGEVFLDSWVGRVERIMDKVVLRFPDGAM